MRKAVLVLGGLVAILMLVCSGMIGWMLLFRPLMRPVTNRKFAATPQRLERGRYIAENLASCIRCHSPNDLLKPLPGTEGTGWVMPAPHDNVVKHRMVASNITPDKQAGIGLWSDDEIGRAIREGVDREGRSFSFAMPSLEYRKMGDEDLASVVVYLRSLPPVRNNLPTTRMIFPVNFLVRLVPLPLTAPVTPDLSTAEKRGEYLMTVATCGGCHSTHDFAGHLIAGLDFAGGDVLRVGSSSIAAPNLTPDKTGIPGITAEEFRDTMRTGRRGEKKLHPLMPCDQYARLTDGDLNDMYAYLRVLKPVRHLIDGSAGATLCRVCQKEHGGGSLN